LGACGITNKDTDYIVAVATTVFDNYPGYVNKGNTNTNPICGRQIVATAFGEEVTVSVVDRCQGCAAGDLDFSPSAFEKLADFALGRIPIEWRWV
jgi:expansin (peptidoglycan-binding protein)